MMRAATPTPLGKIIVINGPSSAGKTTLALALQKQLPEPFIRFSFDALRDHKAFPSQQINNGVFAWKDLRPAVFRGVHRCVPALAIAGNNVIFEHIIETKAWLYDLVDLLARLDVFFVGLHCSLPELERREQARGDRRVGEARMDFMTVHGIPTYDLQLNSEYPLDENVAALIKAWQARSNPNALDKMLAQIKDNPI